MVSTPLQPDYRLVRKRNESLRISQDDYWCLQAVVAVWAVDIIPLFMQLLVSATPVNLIVGRFEDFSCDYALGFLCTMRIGSNS